MIALLPMKKLINDAYDSVFHPFRNFLAKTWGWILVIWLGGDLTGLIAAQYMPREEALQFVGYFSYPFTAALAVTWHRNVQLNEQVNGVRAVRFRWRELKFLGLSALVSAGVFVPLIFAAWLNKEITADPTTIGIGALLVTLGVCIYLSFRLELVLPLTAIDETGAISKSWRLLKGNWLRSGLISLTAALPLSFVSDYIGKAAHWAALNDHFVLAVLSDGVATVVYAMSVCTGAASLSLILMHLRGTGAVPSAAGS